MDAVFIALAVGMIALALVAAIVVFAALALVGMKAIYALHEGRTWFSVRLRHHRAS